MKLVPAIASSLADIYKAKSDRLRQKSCQFTYQQQNTTETDGKVINTDRSHLPNHADDEIRRRLWKVVQNGVKVSPATRGGKPTVSQETDTQGNLTSGGTYDEQYPLELLGDLDVPVRETGDIMVDLSFQGFDSGDLYSQRDEHFPDDGFSEADKWNPEFSSQNAIVNETYDSFQPRGDLHYDTGGDENSVHGYDHY